MNNKDEIKKAVQEGYSLIVRQKSSCCARDSCCGPSVADTKLNSEKIGYAPEDLENVPAESNLGLGCGNPAALGTLTCGEVVLDLGAGAGLDCFLAAGKVGEQGRVIGVDMTPEMVSKARENALKHGYRNVEFRLGEIENLPVADASVDVILSNCVINLSPEKEKVFREAYRVLKPGGRLAISDLVLLKDLPDEIKNSPEAYIGCIAGAEKKDVYLVAVEKAGFEQIEIVEETIFFEGAEISGAVASLKFIARKPV